MTTRKYAPIGKALGECARSGRKMLLRDMVYDGYTPGILVDPRWYEPEHPQEKLHPIEDVVQTKMQAPDLDRPAIVVTFPRYDIANDRVIGSMLESDYLNFDSAGLPTLEESEWVDSDGFLIEDESGEGIEFATLE